MTTRVLIGIAVVESDDHFLVGRRSAEVPLPGMAEFPGGKCEADETPRACAIRECHEETGLIVAPVDQLAVVPWSYPHGEIELHFWKCRPVPGPPPTRQPSPPFQWLPRQQLAELNFPPANAAVLKLLLSEDAAVSG